MIDELFLLINALIVLMMAIYVNHTERLVLQSKEELRKSLQFDNTQGRMERVSEEKPIDCTDIHVGQGSGIYTIYPKGIGRINVYCDLDTHNIRGGWTVFQHRETGEEDFNRGWNEYEYGFGDIRKEFWLGNSKLNAITSQGRYELLILLEDEENNRAFARYDFFKIGNAISNYKLSIGEYSGTAGNGLESNNNEPFTTKDKDNIYSSDTNCARKDGGGWWFVKQNCTNANLNGRYFTEMSSNYGVIYWYHQRDSFLMTLRKTTMMICRFL